QNASIAQCPRAEFHPSLEPPDNIAFSQLFGNISSQFFEVFIMSCIRAISLQDSIDFLIRKLRTKVRPVRAIAMAIQRALVPHKNMPHSVGGTHSTTSITSCGLNPQIFENVGAKNFSVCDAIESNSTGKHKVFRSRQFSCGTC